MGRCRHRCGKRGEQSPLSQLRPGRHRTDCCTLVNVPNHQHRAGSPPIAVAIDHSMAVLPSASRSSDADNAYITAGMHEDLQTQLTARFIEPNLRADLLSRVISGRLGPTTGSSPEPST